MRLDPQQPQAIGDPPLPRARDARGGARHRAAIRALASRFALLRRRRFVERARELRRVDRLRVARDAALAHGAELGGMTRATSISLAVAIFRPTAPQSPDAYAPRWPQRRRLSRIV